MLQISFLGFDSSALIFLISKIISIGASWKSLTKTQSFRLKLTENSVESEQVIIYNKNIVRYKFYLTIYNK